MAGPASLVDRAKSLAATTRERVPGLAHALRMQQRITAVNAQFQ